MNADQSTAIIEKFSQRPEISDDICAELNFQANAYYCYVSPNLEKAQQEALRVLKNFMGDKNVSTIQVDEASIAAGDFGFRYE